MIQLLNEMWWVFDTGHLYEINNHIFKTHRPPVWVHLSHPYIMLTLVWYSKYVWSSLSLPNHSFSYSSSMPFHRNSSHHPCKAALNDLLIRFIIKGQFSPEWSSKQDKTQKTHWLMAADLTVSPPPTWATVISSLMNLMLMKSSGSSESSTARQSEADRLVYMMLGKCVAFTIQWA